VFILITKQIDYKINTQIAKELQGVKGNSSFGQITGIQSDTKNGNFWKTQQKLKKSKKKKLLTEIEPLQLAF